MVRKKKGKVKATGNPEEAQGQNQEVKGRSFPPQISGISGPTPSPAPLADDSAGGMGAGDGAEALLPTSRAGDPAGGVGEGADLENLSLRDLNLDDPRDSYHTATHNFMDDRDVKGECSAKYNMALVSPDVVGIFEAYNMSSYNLGNSTNGGRTGDFSST